MTLSMGCLGAQAVLGMVELPGQMRKLRFREEQHSMLDDSALIRGEAGPGSVQAAALRKLVAGPAQLMGSASGDLAMAMY